MPSRPINIRVDLKDAPHVLNQAVREVNQRLDVTNQVATRTQFQTHLRFDKGISIGGGSSISKEIKQSTSLNFGAVAANSAKAVTLTVNGALQTSGTVFASPQTTLGNNNLVWSAWVSAPNVVEVRLANPTGGAITPNVVFWNVWCRQ